MSGDVKSLQRPKRAEYERVCIGTAGEGMWGGVGARMAWILLTPRRSCYSDHQSNFYPKIVDWLDIFRLMERDSWWGPGKLLMAADFCGDSSFEEGSWFVGYNKWMVGGKWGKLCFQCCPSSGTLPLGLLEGWAKTATEPTAWFCAALRV